jgi:hypothetical protein
MKCPACGEENPFGTQFCKKCGCDLSGIPQAVQPPPEKQEEPPVQALQCSCGASNPPGANFCSSCGKPLAPQVGAQPSPAQARVILPDNTEILVDAPETEINRENIMDKGVGKEDYMKVSQKHCKIIHEGGQYYIQDVGTHGTGSTNGTLVRRVGEIRGRGKVPLIDGDEIVLGTAVRVQFKVS